MDSKVKDGLPLPPDVSISILWYNPFLVILFYLCDLRLRYMKNIDSVQLVKEEMESDGA
jgi:hypothetical protein